MRLRSRDLVDVAIVLLCGKWMTRLWTLQEICLANDGLVLTALGPVKFKDIIRTVRYLSGNQEDQEDILGTHDPSILQTVHDAVDASKFEQMYLRLARLVFVEGQKPFTSLALSCSGRRTGNDIDYARAFFPLLGLEWKVQNSREEGMKQIYDSQAYYSKRMVLMHGSPRSSFRPGWAPSYLTGLMEPRRQGPRWSMPPILYRGAQAVSKQPMHRGERRTRAKTYRMRRRRYSGQSQRREPWREQ